MQEQPTTEKINELKKQQQEALEALVKLAEERKADDFDPWNNPEDIQKIIDGVAERVKAQSEEAPELARLISTIAGQYSALLQHFGEQTDKMAEGKVNDSISSFLKLMTCMEMLFIAYISTLDYQLDLLAGSGEAFDKLQDAVIQDAQGFQSIIDVMRKQHDALFSIRYLTKI